MSPALLSIILIASNIFLILLNHRFWSSKKISLNSCWQSDNLMSLNYIGNLATSLSLSSSDRVCSFIWIRGSKHCFLTSFSNFYCYFPFSSIFSMSLLTSFFATFLVVRDSDLLSHFRTFCTPDTRSYMHPHVSGTHYAFSRSKTLVGTWYQD